MQLLPQPLTGPPARMMRSRQRSSQGSPTCPAGKFKKRIYLWSEGIQATSASSGLCAACLVGFPSGVMSTIRMLWSDEASNKYCIVPANMLNNVPTHFCDANSREQQTLSALTRLHLHLEEGTKAHLQYRVKLQKSRRPGLMIV